MSTPVNFNNIIYPVPVQGDLNWGPALTRYLVALGTFALSPAGGNRILTADLNLGPNFGIIDKYFTSSSTTPATAGTLRLAKTDSIEWRNNANSADNILAVNSSDALTYNGNPVQGLPILADNQIWIGNSSNLPISRTLSGAITTTDTGVTTLASNYVTNSMINSAAAIAYSKLNLLGMITNTDISSSASIAYSKLALSNSIVNVDINSVAAVALTKLAPLSASIVPVTDGSGFLTSSAVTATTLTYLDATSSIQTQLNSKQSTLTIGNLTDVGTDGIVVTNGAGSVIGSGTSLAQHVSDVSHNGYLTSTDWAIFNAKQPAGNYITALTGDITATGPGSAVATLATVNSNVGSFTSANITVNAKGLITAAASGSGGSGTINNGTAPNLSYYAANGTTLSETIGLEWDNTLKVLAIKSDNGADINFYKLTGNTLIGEINGDITAHQMQFSAGGDVLLTSGTDTSASGWLFGANGIASFNSFFTFDTTASTFGILDQNSNYNQTLISNPITGNLDITGSSGGVLFRSSSLLLSDSSGIFDSSNAVQLAVPTTVVGYPIVFPAAQGAANTFLLNDGIGNMSWALGGAGIVSTATATAQSANITATTLFTPSAAGNYRISVYLVDSAADVTAGAVTATIGYTDAVQAQSLSTSAVLLTTLGTFTQATFFIRAASGVAITYATSHTGIFGSARYNIYVTAERLS